MTQAPEDATNASRTCHNAAYQVAVVHPRLHDIGAEMPKQMGKFSCAAKRELAAWHAKTMYGDPGVFEQGAILPQALQGNHNVLVLGVG